MDKQALKKHHFWILLGLSVVLIPVVLAGAVWGVGGEASAKAKLIDDKKQALTKQQPKGKTYRDKLDEQKAELVKQKNRVWKAAYGAQAGLMTWPRALDHLNPQMVSPNPDAENPTPAKLYFGDPIDDRDRAVFRNADVYQAEYDRLPEIIAPTEFADKSWQKVLAPRFSDWAKTAVPSSEEVWLALEDLCVQRELLRDIHAVNQMLAEFLPVPQEPRKPAEAKSAAPEEQKRYQEDLNHYATQRTAYETEKSKVDKELAELLKPQRGEFVGRFISPYWRLDLAVGRVTGGKAGELRFRGRLTNTSPRRQNVARIEFKIWLRNPAAGPNVDYALLPIQAEYLAAGASVDFNESRVGPTEPSLKVYKVEQKLDTRYVPVKRVDQLVLGKLSHRFANRDLVPTAFSDEEIKKAPPPPTTPDAAGGAPIGRGGPGGMANDVNFTPNLVPRKRYLERTDQVRRMPIALVLIVDQGHVQDVIRALSNSRLRFQPTQVHYERFRGTISLGMPEMVAGVDVPAPPGPAGPQGPGAGRPDPTRGDRRPPRGEDDLIVERPGAGRQPPRGATAPPIPGGGIGLPPFNPSVEEESPSNLVELTIYGLISLYEQYPPKPAAGQQPPGDASQPAPAGQPPATPPAPPAAPVPPNAPIPPPPAAPGGGLPPPAPAGPNPTANPPPPGGTPTPPSP